MTEVFVADIQGGTGSMIKSKLSGMALPEEGVMIKIKQPWQK
jgi:hypothetical protein